MENNSKRKQVKREANILHMQGPKEKLGSERRAQT